MKSILVGSAVVLFASFAMACGCGTGSCGNKDHAKSCTKKSSCESKKSECACGKNKNQEKAKDSKSKS